jgi:tetratricopeptide (TPR) repeat protein
LSEHPTPADLEAFLEDRLEPARVPSLVAHLMQGCERCCLYLAPRLGEVLEELVVPETATADCDLYDAAVNQAVEAVLLHGPLALERTRKLRKALALLTERGMDGLNHRRFGLYASVEALLARSWQLRHENPEQMVYLAYFATSLSSRLEREGFTPQQAKDFQARAMGEYANALRVADRLAEAEDHLREAFQLAALGTGDSAVELRLRDLKASLLGTQHRYPEAIQLLDHLYAVRLVQADQRGAGRTLIKKGLYVGYSGDAEEALALLEKGSAMLDSNRDSGMVRLAIHNRLHFLVEDARLEGAMTLLEQHRDLLRTGGQLDRCKLLDTESRICAGFGFVELAEQGFRDAKAWFLSLRVDGHAALTALDLATVLMRQGKASEARKAAAEALQVFTRLRIPDTQVEALLVLAEALRSELLSAGLLQSIAEFFRRAEHDPKARYQPRFD